MTDNILIAITLLGKIFILLDYPAVFANPALEGDHLLALDLEEPVYCLGVNTGRAVFTTVRRSFIVYRWPIPSFGPDASSLQKTDVMFVKTLPWSS